MTARQFRRGDTVRWGLWDGDMYVTTVDADRGVTTDAWSEIDPAQLVLVEAVEDKYDALLDSIGRALKERQNA
jgi:hypothetical protein